MASDVHLGSHRSLRRRCLRVVLGRTCTPSPVPVKKLPLWEAAGEQARGTGLSPILEHAFPFSPCRPITQIIHWAQLVSHWRCLRIQRLAYEYLKKNEHIAMNLSQGHEHLPMLFVRSEKHCCMKWLGWVCQCVRACCVCAKSLSCLILCDPMDCSLTGSSVHSILQTRILEWDVMPSSDPGTEPASLMSPALTGMFFTTKASWEAYVCAYV